MPDAVSRGGSVEDNRPISRENTLYVPRGTKKNYSVVQKWWILEAVEHKPRMQ